MSEWQPISSAPRDGQNVVLWKAGQDPQIGRWYDTNVEGFYANQIGRVWYSNHNPPTHWAPIPELPHNTTPAQS